MAYIQGTDAQDFLDQRYVTDDLIDAKGGNDYVYAGDGADTILGGSGVDWLNGEAGNDLRTIGQRLH